MAAPGIPYFKKSASVPGWTPYDLIGLSHWWMASDLTNGIAPVVSDRIDGDNWGQLLSDPVATNTPSGLRFLANAIYLVTIHDTFYTGAGFIMEIDSGTGLQWIMGDSSGGYGWYYNDQFTDNHSLTFNEQGTKISCTPPTNQVFDVFFFMTNNLPSWGWLSLNGNSPSDSKLMPAGWYSQERVGALHPMFFPLNGYIREVILFTNAPLSYTSGTNLAAQFHTYRVNTYGP